MHLATAVVATLLAFPGIVAAQSDASSRGFSISPALLEEGGDYTLAARFNAAIASQRHDATGNFVASRYWGIEGKGALAVKADANPDPLTLDLAAGIDISFARSSVIPFEPERVDEPRRAAVRRFGRVSLAVQAHGATNQPRSEARAALGGMLLYSHDNQHGAWPFVPAIFATVGAGRSLASEVRDSLGLPDDESFLRLEGSVTWHIWADRQWMPRALRPLAVHAELAMYRESGVEEPVASLGLDDGTRVALALAYRLLGTKRRAVDEVFVRWTNGETPTLPAPKKAWMIGIVLAP
jgi:hypothetical protein